MEIRIAEKAGFCFGVDRAVKIAYSSAPSENCEKVFTCGMLIHNGDVIRELEEKGVCCAETPEQIPDGACAIIRAHGISAAEYAMLEKKGCRIIDATCPYVKRIHRIVSEEHAAGRQIIIAGDKNHPEVIGINGWCDDSALIVGNDENYDEILLKSAETPVSIVAQTTMRKEKIKKIEKNLKKHFTNAKFFDTICSATEERQKAAAELAGECDLMLVLGGKNSSNTQKLYEICREHCSETYKAENSKELNELSHLFKKNILKVGITAGASTPDKVIKEAKLTMAEITNEMNFAEAVEETLKPLSNGDIVKGVVIGITPTEVQVDIDGKYDGVIPFSELTNDTTADINSLVSIGDEVDVFVVHVSDRDGVVTLSKKKIDAEKGLRELQEDFENGTVLNGRIVEIVKGGVVTIAKGVRVFIPASEAAERFVEDLGSLLNTEASFRIIKMDKDRRGRLRVVGSIKSVAKEISAKKAEEFWANAEVNKKYTGTVKSLTNFGAFVDLGGVDGLIHISELSNLHIKHPSEVVKVGDTIDVYIKELNRETNKISLGHKKEEDSPWYKATKDLKVGDNIKCKIVRILPFGAFAEIAPFVDGLIHISQISNTRIAKPSDVLNIGDEVEAQIIEINNETKQIGLSMKVLLPDYDAAAADSKAESASDESYTEEGSFTLGDILDAE